MATTDHTGPGGEPPGSDEPPRGPVGWQRGVRRYGPVAAMVALVAGAVIVFGGGSGDDGDAGGGEAAEVAGDELISRRTVTGVGGPGGSWPAGGSLRTVPVGVAGEASTPQTTSRR